MSKVFRFELSRAMGGIRFRIAVVVGIAASIMHFLTDVLPLVKWLDEWKGDSFAAPHSAYRHWIGMDLSTVWPVLLFMVLPLLAALPAAEHDWYDRNSGYLNQIRLRCEIWQDKMAKTAAVFASAFVVTVIPLTVDFLLTSAVLPCIAPEPASGLYSITDRSMFGALFYQFPMLYVVGYTIFDGVFIAVWTTLSLTFSRWLNQRFQVILAPFLIYLIFYFLGIWSETSNIAPMAILLPFQPIANISFGIPCAILGGLLLLLFVCYFSPWRLSDEV